MTRKKKNEQDIDYDFNVAINSADNFRAIAQAYIKSLSGVRLNESNKLNHQMGTIISSATNLSLALEIYLKSIYMTLKMKVPDSHHLWSIFKNIPLVHQNEIKARYNERNTKVGSDLAAVRIYSQVGKSNEFDPPESLRKSGPIDLKSVLVRSSDAFTTWRYFYEKCKKSDWEVFEYEFKRLDIVCEIVREYVLEIREKA